MSRWAKQYIRSQLPSLVNDTLSQPRRWLVERWLAGDAGLREELEQLHKLRSAVQGQRDLSPSTSVLANIKAAIVAQPAQPAPAPRIAIIWPIIIAALALSAFLLWQAMPPGLEVSWSLAGNAPDSFKVYRAPVEAASLDEFTLIGELPAQSGVDRYDYTDLRLIPGQQFQYLVEAVDDSGFSVTSQALVGNSLEALPRQLLFAGILIVIIFALISALRQYRTEFGRVTYLAI